MCIACLGLPALRPAGLTDQKHTLIFLFFYTHSHRAGRGPAGDGNDQDLPCFGSGVDVLAAFVLGVLDPQGGSGPELWGVSAGLKILFIFFINPAFRKTFFIVLDLPSWSSALCSGGAR